MLFENNYFQDLVCSICSEFVLYRRKYFKNYLCSPHRQNKTSQPRTQLLEMMMSPVLSLLVFGLTKPKQPNIVFFLTDDQDQVCVNEFVSESSLS